MQVYAYFLYFYVIFIHTTFSKDSSNPFNAENGKKIFALSCKLILGRLSLSFIFSQSTASIC